MAKKTRAQKIITELRRKIKANQLKTDSSFLPSSEKSLRINEIVNKEIDKKPINPVIFPQAPKKEFYLTNINFIKKDLSKTFFLSIFILSLELILYLVLESNSQFFSFKNFL